MDNTKTVYKTKKSKTRNDIIFIASFLAVVILIGFCVFYFRLEGDKVTVSVDGKVFGEYLLNQDQTVEIKTDDNFNVLIIKDGKAFVESASCPDLICSSHRPIFRDGETIVCLPNKVLITVILSESNAPDVLI